ncbi:MAG: lipase family protein [Sneathiella sp.]
MSPLEAAICAKIAYDPNGAARAKLLGYSYQPVQSRDHFAWIGTKDGITVVAFRGTALFGREVKSYRSNLSTDLVPWVGAGRVHEGYYQALWQILGAIRREIGGASEVVLTGHSMGGALAMLAAMPLEVSRVHAFASPRIGNREFAEGYSRAIRVSRYVNRADVLARLPFSGMVQGSSPPRKEEYVHVGRTIRLPGFGHSISAHIAGIKMRRRGQYQVQQP